MHISHPPASIVTALLAVGLLVISLLPVRSASADGILEPPRNVTAVASAAAARTIDVTWEAPVGDAPVGYVLNIDRLIDQAWVDIERTREVTTVSRQVFDDLVNGETYRARIRAIFPGGVAQESSNSAVPYGVPGRPTITSAVPGDGTVSLSWSAPSSNGRPITSYTISYADGEQSVDVAGNSTSHTVAGLTNDTNYRFRVTATNLRGDGLPSNAFEATPTLANNGDPGVQDPPGSSNGDTSDDGDQSSEEPGEEQPGEESENGDEQREETDDSQGDDTSDGQDTSDDESDQHNGSEQESDGSPGTGNEAPNGDEGATDPNDEDDPDGPDESTDPDLPAGQVFSDVAPGSTHADNIARLVEIGITEGCGNGEFCPTDPVTRQQMASFLVRALRLPAADEQPFVDVPEGSTHDASIRSLAAFGITRGCTEERFCPTDPVTRGQMASFIARGFALPAPETPAAFDDVDEDHPHRVGISALAEAGVTLGCSPDEFCPAASVTREQMASFIMRALDYLDAALPGADS